MKKWFKRIVMSGVILLIAAFVGVAIFILNVDPASYKNKLAQLIKEQYNRELVVHGDIELSLFPRIGLSVNDIVLSEPGSTQAFVEIAKVRMAVALWPLISNRFLVDNLAIDGFKANIIRDEHGKLNFDDLIRYSLIQEDASTGPEVNISTQERIAKTDFKVDIAGLTLSNGQLNFTHQTTDTQLSLDKMSIRTGRITQGQLFDLSLQADIHDGQHTIATKLVLNGLVDFKPLEHKYAFNRLKADMLGSWKQLTLSEASLTGNVELDLKEDALIGTDIDFHMLAQGHEGSNIQQQETSLTATHLNYNVSNLRLALKDFKFNLAEHRQDKQSLHFGLDAPNLDISPSSAGGEPVNGDFLLKSDNQEMKVSFALEKITGTAIHINVADAQFKGIYSLDDKPAVSVSLNSPVNITTFPQMIDLSGLTGILTLSDDEGREEHEIMLKGKAHSYLQSQEINYALNAHLGTQDFAVNGHILGLFHPELRIDVSGEQLDFKALLKSLHLSPSLIDSRDSNVPQVRSDDGVATTDTQENLESTIAKTDDFSLKQLLLSRLSGLGTFNFKQLSYDDIVLKDLGATVNFNQNEIKLRSLKAKIFDGEVRANGNYALKEQALEGDVLLERIELSKALNFNYSSLAMSGRANAGFVFSTQGNNPQTLFKNLKAEFDLSMVEKGQLSGIDLLSILAQPEEFMNPWDLSVSLIGSKNDLMPINSLVFKANLSHEQLFIHDLSVDTPQLLLKAKEGEADYQFGADYLYLPTILTTKTGLKVKKGPVTVQVKKVQLPLLIQGPLSSLDARLQLESLFNK